MRERRERLLGGGGQDDDDEANEIMPCLYLGFSAYLWSQKGLMCKARLHRNAVV